MFLGGPEFRALSNEHAAMMLHAFVGGAYGYFTGGLNGVPPQNVGFFPNQFTWAGAFGGSIDLNRSPRLVFRIAPDATLTNFGGVQVERAVRAVGGHGLPHGASARIARRRRPKKHHPWWRP